MKIANKIMIIIFREIFFNIRLLWLYLITLYQHKNLLQINLFDFPPKKLYNIIVICIQSKFLCNENNRRSVVIVPVGIELRQGFCFWLRGFFLRRPKAKLFGKRSSWLFFKRQLRK